MNWATSSITRIHSSSTNLFNLSNLIREVSPEMIKNWWRYFVQQSIQKSKELINWNFNQLKSPKSSLVSSYITTRVYSSYTILFLAFSAQDFNSSFYQMVSSLIWSSVNLTFWGLFLLPYGLSLELLDLLGYPKDQLFVLGLFLYDLKDILNTDLVLASLYSLLVTQIPQVGQVQVRHFQGLVQKLVRKNLSCLRKMLTQESLNCCFLVNFWAKNFVPPYYKCCPKLISLGNRL